MKALREVPGELHKQFYGVEERDLRWRPARGDWCLKEIAAHMRDYEQLVQRQIELISRRREPRLPHEAIDVLPSERDYRAESVIDLLYEYANAREETGWLLYTLEEDDWLRAGIHPYRARVSIYDIARELHEHDLQHLYQAQTVRKALSQRPSRAKRAP